MQLHEIEEFFAEQDVIMNMPDEDVDEFLSRLTAEDSRWHSDESRTVHATSEASTGNEQRSSDRNVVSSSSVKRKPAETPLEHPPERHQKRTRTNRSERRQHISFNTPDNDDSDGEAAASFAENMRHSEPISELSVIMPEMAQKVKGHSTLKRKSALDSVEESSIGEISFFSEAEMGPSREAPSPTRQSKKGSATRHQYVPLSDNRISGSVSLNTHLSPIEDISNDDDHTKPTLGEQPANKLKVPDPAHKIAPHAASFKRAKVVKISRTDVQESAVIGMSGQSSIIETPSSPLASRASTPVTDQQIQAETSKTRTKRTMVTRNGKEKKRKIPLEEKPTPYEYAMMLQDKAAKVAERPKNKAGPSQYLEGKVIFYIGGEMKYASETTRGRMDIIVKHGGTLLPAYDPSKVTHIVTDAPRKPTLRALGLESLKDIPNHIPTVKWGWVISGLGRNKKKVIKNGQEVYEVEMEDLCMHAAFNDDDRFFAGVDRGKSLTSKGKEKALIKVRPQGETKTINQEADRISEFSQQKRANGANPLAIGSSSTKQPVGSSFDPLAEFYAQARADRDSGWSRKGEVESDIESDEAEYEVPKGPQPKRGFTCDNKEVQRNSSVNQDIIDKLLELMELHKSKPSEEDRWRAFSYGKCIRALRNYPKRINSFNEARSIRGVGEKTALKIMEILQTGNLKRINYERTEDVTVTHLFQGVYGVGQSTAFKWYASGCRSLEDVVAGKGGVKLSPAQEIGIRFYNDINSRMPRAEAQAIFDLIKPIALHIDPDLFIEIMGSFRRGKADCGDIDILITRCPYDGRTHAGVLPVLLRRLREVAIITEDLALPEEDGLEAVYRGLCRLPKEGSCRRRIDILVIPWECRGAALLYYTGDDIFNRAMRLKANVMGYSLNQRGLFKGVVRDPRDRRTKTNTGTLIASETEEEIFRILGVPWQEPHERVRG